MPSVERVWAMAKPVINKIICENLDLNSRLNERFHLRPIVNQALEIVESKLSDSIFFANGRDLVRALTYEEQ